MRNQVLLNVVKGRRAELTRELCLSCGLLARRDGCGVVGHDGQMSFWEGEKGWWWEGEVGGRVEYVW